ncbi:MAG: hypothetical protein COW67_01565 [Flavobacteriales bacterium CG18_big_fil_WC_8_21_14_2_50_32_9]|nr:hypothetical protein [Flavobacteriales bacterium]PIQ16702.1 MAG: hypothetical protein COW67_01565 [Flavobacteriales bacterium CG18_big_fil_WC_8_21_14_2_50_32_9]PJC63232.1 MAG: hypothetical protein CO022_00335 [Flavobacteriales bacterium CG_4_9_14_0_2_um_filter_32_27]
MATILLEGKSASTIKLLMELAQKLGVKMTVLDNSNIEDMKLGQFMDEVRTNTFAEEEEILKKLTEK